MASKSHGADDPTCNRSTYRQWKRFLLVQLLWPPSSCGFCDPRISTLPRERFAAAYSLVNVGIYHEALRDGKRTHHGYLTVRSNRLSMATSSSELKKKRSPSPPLPSRTSPPPSSERTNKEKLPRNSVVRRLKKAATLAVEEANNRKRSEDKNLGVVPEKNATAPPSRGASASSRASPPSSPDPKQHQSVDDTYPLSSSSSPSSPTRQQHLPTLRQLTQIIDQRLQRRGTAGSVHNGFSNTPPDSMGALYLHNHRNPRDSASDDALLSTRHVAVLLAKPLRDDQLTLEGAARVRHLLHSILAGQYSPRLVVFWGSITGDNRVADADAAYLYFRSLWASSTAPTGSAGSSLPKRPEFYLERSPIDPAGLQQTVHFIQQNFVPSWWEELLATDEQKPEGTTPLTTTRRNKPRKLQIHFSLVSSEYQLCQLNDIHIRSPNQSALRALRTLARASGVSSPQVEPPTWSFHGVTSWLSPPSVPPTAADKMSSRGRDGTQPQPQQLRHTHHYPPLRAFCAKTYKTAQDMVPVLYNLRGVVDHREFFQRDNYRALVAARRSLIADMERMYHLQPGLQSVHHPAPTSSSSATSTSSDKPSVSSSLSQPASSNASSGWSPSSSLLAEGDSASSPVSPVTSHSPNGRQSHLAPQLRGAGAGGLLEGSAGGGLATTANSSSKPLDVVLESALLSLGRCLDLLRPAGLLTGSVPMEDYKRALTSLQQAYYLLDRACDPDEPLPVEDWSRPLSIVISTTEAGAASRGNQHRHHHAGRGPLGGLSWWSHADARGSAEPSGSDRANALGNAPSSDAAFPMTPL